MKKVLVVDDTKNIRSLLTTCLEIRNFDVLTAENGKTALNIIREEMKEIDLIFLDIRMPEMNGTEVLKSIRDMGLNCPVIVMTAFATVKNAVDCTKLGAIAYLQKPFSPERVNAVLDEIFSEQDIERAGTADVQSGKTLVSSAAELIEKGKYKEAHDALKKALSFDPYNREVYSLIGKVNEKMNNIDEAKRFYTMASLFRTKNI